ncbi:MAG: hypothetical protein CVV46_16145 [Spirochaetae bacterium HGW-Spirochaetae-2]|nr:MAG: hypothetical protein CVV46_16145 [Spirochaetae bacterium HGW-Spirochaetae-2]
MRETIRVLPLQLHSNCNNLSETIASRITEGYFVNDSMVRKSLRRHWNAGLSRQLHRFIPVGAVDDVLERLLLLPGFSILSKNRLESSLGMVHQKAREESPANRKQEHAKSCRFPPVQIINAFHLSLNLL